MLVDELNHMFRDVLVEARPGGARGGGARLTETGTDVVRRYRAIESTIESDSSANIAALERLVTAQKRIKPA
jgi:molybdate transport system regulatory protein